MCHPAKSALRSAKASFSLVTFVVLVIYYGLLAAGAQMNESGTLPAAIAMELGNILMLVWGAVAFRRATR